MNHRRTLKRGLPSLTGPLLGLISVAILLISSCGGNSADKQSEVAGASQDAVDTPTPTTSRPTTTSTTTEVQPEPTTTTTTEPEPELQGERLHEPLPFRDDPCSDRLPAGQHWFSMLLNDNGTITEIPILIEVIGNVVDAGIIPRLVIDFHSNEFAESRGLSGGSTQRNSDRWGGTVFVNPRADTTLTPVWAKSATFDGNVVTQLWEELNGSLCFNPDNSAWGGLMEGNQLVVEAICETNIPMSHAVLGLGMHFREGCSPSRPVPVSSSDVFTPLEGGSPHWDGPFTPPNVFNAKAGSYEGAPVSLDRWAELYNCTDDRLEETAPDPDDLLERDSVFFGYTDCDAPLLAYATQVAPNRFTPDIGAQLAPQFVELRDALFQVFPLWSDGEQK